MDDNATCHRTLAVQDCLDSEGIQSLVWPERSPDLNPIKNVWDALGRQAAGRNYPPTNKNTLIRALTEEWDKLPQQLLDNVVQNGNSSRKKKGRPASFQAKKYVVPDDVGSTNRENNQDPYSSSLTTYLSRGLTAHRSASMPHRPNRYSVPLRHGGTLNSRRAASHFDWLVEGKERWEAPGHLLGFLPLNWGGTEQNRTVTCMVLKAKVNDRRKNSSP
ncbi:transposable element Tc1 transposase [Trichonephila clavipes]|nr:transposable element Tc1 transposase [Trichonephila clavipes]